MTDPLVLQGDHDLVSFARCMRAHGVQMSDPYHQPGRTSPQFRSADSACRHLLPAGVTDDGTGP